MMAAVMLVVAFVGMIQAITIGSEMQATARRQTLAAQIINHEIESLRFASWATITALPTSATSLGSAWNAGTSYNVGDTATRSGNWYRCIVANSGQTPPNTAYWIQDNPPYSGFMTTAGAAYGATFTLARTVSSPDPVTNIREVNFTVTWVVKPSGLNVSRTYTRTNTAWYGKYGLNLTYQRS